MADVRGIVAITTFDKDGNVLDFYKGQNKVLDVGIAAIWQRIALPDGANAYQFGTLSLGDDIGIGSQWNIFNPQPPNRGFDGSDQNVTHSLPKSGIIYDFPNDSVLQVTTTIDGTTFMNANFPNDIDYQYTSMTLRFNNDTPWAFKRFPVRSISREVVVRINWTFTVINQEEWCSNDL